MKSQNNNAKNPQGRFLANIFVSHNKNMKKKGQCRYQIGQIIRNNPIRFWFLKQKRQ